MPDFDLPPPIRDGLLQLQPPRLLGARCEVCSTRSFPMRQFCPSCGHEAVERVALASDGTVYSYTVVRQAPGDRAVPYVLAYVDLDDDVRLLAQVDEPPSLVHIGLRVRLTLRNVVPPPGSPRLGYAFVGVSDVDSQQEQESIQ
ncbi:MAG: Zn-ribbon domain-containing OB-fold protein [Pigmentiphaga sp.]